MRSVVHNPTVETDKGGRERDKSQQGKETNKEKRKIKMEKQTDGGDSKWEMYEKKGMKQNKKEEKRDRIISNKETEKGNLLLSPLFSLFVFDHQLTPFFLSSFWLCLSVCVFHALWLSLVFFVCVCVPASHMECYQGVRHRAVTHWQSPPTPLWLPLAQTKRWLDWASDRAQHGLTADAAFPLKGQTTTLHHIWNSQ